MLIYQRVISYIQILAISFATDRHVLEGMFFLDNYLSNCFPDATHAFGQKKQFCFYLISLSTNQSCLLKKWIRQIYAKFAAMASVHNLPFTVVFVVFPLSFAKSKKHNNHWKHILVKLSACNVVN